MKNILKTVLPVIEIFSTFSLNNTYATHEEHAINREIVANEINLNIREMEQISMELKYCVDTKQYKNMDLQTITDRLHEIRNLTSPFWYLNEDIINLQKYYYRNLDERAIKLLQQYIWKYFEIVNLTKKIL